MASAAEGRLTLLPQEDPPKEELKPRVHGCVQEYLGLV